MKIYGYFPRNVKIGNSSEKVLPVQKGGLKETVQKTGRTGLGYSKFLGVGLGTTMYSGVWTTSKKSKTALQDKM